MLPALPTDRYDGGPSHEVAVHQPGLHRCEIVRRVAAARRGPAAAPPREMEGWVRSRGARAVKNVSHATIITIALIALTLADLFFSPSTLSPGRARTIQALWDDGSRWHSPPVCGSTRWAAVGLDLCAAWGLILGWSASSPSRPRVGSAVGPQQRRAWRRQRIQRRCCRQWQRAWRQHDIRCGSTVGTATSALGCSDIWAAPMLRHAGANIARSSAHARTE